MNLSAASSAAAASFQPRTALPPARRVRSTRHDPPCAGTPPVDDAATFRSKRARQASHEGIPARWRPPSRPAPQAVAPRPVAQRSASTPPSVVATAEAWRDHLNLDLDIPLGTATPAQPQRLLVQAQLFAALHHRRLPVLALDQIFHSQGSHILRDATPPDPFEPVQIAFLAQELAARSDLDGRTVNSIVLGMRNAVPSEGGTALLQALAGSLQASRPGLSADQLGHVLRHLVRWATLPPGPALDAALTGLIRWIASATGVIRLTAKDVRNALEIIETYSNHPLGARLLEVLTDLLSARPPTLQGQDCDSILSVLSYLPTRCGGGPGMRRLLGTAAYFLQGIAPAARTVALARVCKNLHRLPSCRETEDLLATLTPWIHDASCRLGSAEFSAVLRGIHPREAPARLMRRLTRAISRQLARAHVAGMDVRTMTTTVGYLATIDPKLLGSTLADQVRRLVTVVQGRMDLVAIATVCQAITVYRYWADTSRVTRELVRHCRALPASDAPVGSRHMTMILCALSEQRDSPEGSDLAEFAASLLPRLAAAPTPTEWHAWAGALFGLGRTRGAYALADGLLALLRRHGLEDTPERAVRHLSATRVIPDSALARSALRCALAHVEDLTVKGVVNLLMFLCLNPATDIAAILRRATRRLEALHAAGDMELDDIPALVRAFTMLDRRMPTPAFLEKAYAEGVEAWTTRFPPTLRERKLERALAAACERLISQWDAAGGALVPAFHAWHRGIEMDVYFSRIALNLEWDGEVHRAGVHRASWDGARDACLRADGIDVLRIVVIGNHAELDEEDITEQALAQIQAHLEARVATARTLQASLREAARLAP